MSLRFRVVLQEMRAARLDGRPPRLTQPPNVLQRYIFKICNALVLQEARLRDLMEDLHDSFKQRVRESRGERLTGDDAELFSGTLRCAGLDCAGLGWAAPCSARAPSGAALYT